MTKEIIGHTTCPECDFADAEIKLDKNKDPYRYCPDCNAQYFTRGDPVKVANIKKKMRPGKGAPEPEPSPPGPKPKPTPEAAPTPTAKKVGVLDAYLADAAGRK